MALLGPLYIECICSHGVLGLGILGLSFFRVSGFRFFYLRV